MDNLSELQAHIHVQQDQRQLSENSEHDNTQLDDMTNTLGQLIWSCSKFEHGQSGEDELTAHMLNLIYTIEMGHGYKWHKGLSAETDVDTEKFLKVCEKP